MPAFSRRMLIIYAISSVIFFYAADISSKRAIKTILSSSASALALSSETIAPSRHCVRPCPRTRGKIYYAEYTDGGLDDRIFVIEALANLAAFLCADLILKPPRELLQPYHNNNQKLGGDVEWTDFVEARNLGDGELFPLKTEREAFGRELAEERPRECYACPNDADKCHWRLQRFDEKCVAFRPEKEPKHRGWLHVVSHFTSDHLDDLKKVFARSWDEQTDAGFLWEIHMSYWLTPVGKDNEALRSMPIPAGVNRTRYLEMVPGFTFSWPPIDFGQGCHYVDVTYSSPIRQLQQTYLTEIARLALDDASFGLLHLRRADATQDCDTSVPKLREYLTCSLANMVALHANITIVLTTDEKDQSYRRDVLQLADGLGEHLTILDGDAIAQKVVADAAEVGLIKQGMVNNFATFAVEAALRRGDFIDRPDFIDFRFTRRRQTCPDCEGAVT